MSLSNDEIQFMINLLKQVLELLQSEIKPSKQKTNENKSKFNLDAINWLDTNRAPASANAPWAWAFVFNRDGDIHPEIEPIYEEVCRYGELEIDEWVISLGGREDQLLNKRKKKES